MNLAEVMDEIAARLDTITDLQVFGWPADTVHPPAAVVSYPETYSYDETYGRGMDRMTLPVIVVVGRPNDAVTRDNLAVYVAGSGPKSFKAVLQSGTYTTFHTVRVVGVEFDVVTIAGDDYMGALFSLDIAGSGV